MPGGALRHGAQAGGEEVWPGGEGRDHLGQAVPEGAVQAPDPLAADPLPGHHSLRPGRNLPSEPAQIVALNQTMYYNQSMKLSNIL